MKGLSQLLADAHHAVRIGMCELAADRLFVVGGQLAQWVVSDDGRRPTASVVAAALSLSRDPSGLEEPALFEAASDRYELRWDELSLVLWAYGQVAFADLPDTARLMTAPELLRVAVEATRYRRESQFSLSA